jgi:nitronate monooxygenase
MALPPILQNLRIPAFGAPLFIVQNPDLVLAQCKAGIPGCFPTLNAREQEGEPIELERWLGRITDELARHDRAHPQRPAAPYGVNLIVHRSNARLERDLEIVVKWKVPIVVTSLGARPEVNDAVHSYGGITLHDVIDDRFARKAIEKGADGLIAVAAGAGGHAGTLSPFALVREIREWFDGPLILSGAIATGDGILAAQAMGADLAYLGSVFIATREANAPEAYKRMIVEGSSSDIVYTSYFTGVYGNYLKQAVRAVGLDPDNLPESGPSRMDFSGGSSKPKAWKDVWSAGQGIGAVKEIVGAAELVDRLEREYHAARARLGLGSGAAAQ